jgi:OOP family OmpA-OmpF porin
MKRALRGLQTAGLAAGLAWVPGCGAPPAPAEPPAPAPASPPAASDAGDAPPDAGTQLDAGAPLERTLPAYAAAPPYRGPPLRFRGFEVTRDGKIKLPRMVHFEVDSPVILGDSDAILERIVRFMAAFPEVTLLRIEAHTDRVGLREHVMKLSSARAVSVAAWLVAHGVDCRRLLPVMVAWDSPLVCNVCPPERRPNRRIELHVALVDGAAPYGPPDAGRAPAGDPCKP